jgi:hypothetical protein
MNILPPRAPEGSKWNGSKPDRNVEIAKMRIRALEKPNQKPAA